VHLRGTATVHDDPDWVYRQVADMTDDFEATQDSPWRVTDAPSDYIRKRLAAIVGVEIDVTQIEGKFKLSQNQSPADRAGAVSGLAASGDPIARLVADLMSPPPDSTQG